MLAGTEVAASCLIATCVGIGGKIVFDWLKNSRVKESKGDFVYKDICDLKHKSLDKTIAGVIVIQGDHNRTLANMDKNIALIAQKMGVETSDTNKK